MSGAASGIDALSPFERAQLRAMALRQLVGSGVGGQLDHPSLSNAIDLIVEWYLSPAGTPGPILFPSVRLTGLGDMQHVFSRTSQRSQSFNTSRATSCERQTVPAHASGLRMSDNPHRITPEAARAAPPEPLRLTYEHVEDLRDVAASTRSAGVGGLRGAAYVGQGYTEVPSAWLVEIIDRMRAAERADALGFDPLPTARLSGA